MQVAAYIALSVLPVVVLAGLLKLIQWLSDGPRLPLRRQRPSTTMRSLETLTADLARLQREFARIQREEPAAMARRLEAVTLAYDDTLSACCTALDLEPPERTPMGGIERLQTEAALAQHGLRW